MSAGRKDFFFLTERSSFWGSKRTPKASLYRNFVNYHANYSFFAEIGIIFEGLQFAANLITVAIKLTKVIFLKKMTMYPSSKKFFSVYFGSQIKLIGVGSPMNISKNGVNSIVICIIN